MLYIGALDTIYIYILQGDILFTTFNGTGWDDTNFFFNFFFIIFQFFKTLLQYHTYQMYWEYGRCSGNKIKVANVLFSFSFLPTVSTRIIYCICIKQSCVMGVFFTFLSAGIPRGMNGNGSMRSLFWLAHFW